MRFGTVVLAREILLPLGRFLEVYEKKGDEDASRHKYVKEKKLRGPERI